MFKRRSQPAVNYPATLPPPVRGFDPSAPLMNMQQTSAVILENWFPRASGIETRPGYSTQISDFTRPVDRLHVYAAGSGLESLWATTALGIYNCDTPGGMPAPAIALTNGYAISTSISTGAGSFMLLVNGTDTLKQYDGTTWTSIAALGTATNLFTYTETYRQRIFFIKKQSLEIEYLPVNSIAGVTVNYPLGALFRLGGALIAMGTWTIDGGTGPEDNLAVITSRGEVAVFAGNDPATWALRGVYFVGRPLGQTCLYKYGGDLLILTESGIFPLSQALQAASIDRVQTVSMRIQPYLVDAAQAYYLNPGWQIFSDPLFPNLFINIPTAPVGRQAVMNSQTGAWCTYTGWNALCFARKSGEIFFGTLNSVERVNGTSDNGTNITATALQAYDKLGQPRDKTIKLARAYFQATGEFQYALGIANSFVTPTELTTINLSGDLSASLWGTGLWGAALWTGENSPTQEWQTVPDYPAPWKALYLQVVSRQGRVTFIGADFRFGLNGDF